MRRTAMAALLAICGVAPPAFAVDPAPSATEADVRAVSRAFDAAQFAGDRAALDRLIASDLVYIRGAGKRVGKAEFIAAFTDPATRFDPFRISDPIYVALGPAAAMVGGEAVLSGRDASGPFREHFLYTDTFARRGGRWQVVHVQVTMAPTEAK